jgi:hypothetical protein
VCGLLIVFGLGGWWMVTFRGTFFVSRFDSSNVREPAQQSLGSTSWAPAAVGTTSSAAKAKMVAINIDLPPRPRALPAVRARTPRARTGRQASAPTMVANGCSAAAAAAERKRMVLI